MIGIPWGYARLPLRAGTEHDPDREVRKVVRRSGRMTKLNPCGLVPATAQRAGKGENAGAVQAGSPELDELRSETQQQRNAFSLTGGTRETEGCR